MHDLIAMLRARAEGPRLSMRAGRASLEAFLWSVTFDPSVRCDEVEVGDLLAEWVRPPAAREGCAFLYFHGGSYISGSPATHRFLTAEISRAARMPAFVPGYRLAPEHPFPAAVQDAVTAYEWLLERGLDPGGIVAGGDSAGGGLAVAMMVAARDKGLPMPAAGVLLSPWTDLAGTGESMRTKAADDPFLNAENTLAEAAVYLAGADPHNPLASPLYAKLHGLPPLLIQVGSREIIRDDSTRLADRAKEAGVQVTLEVWEGMIHVFQLFAPMIPEGYQAIDRIGEFARAHSVCQGYKPPLPQG